MKRLLFAAAALLLAAPAFACDYRVGALCAPTVVEYRTVQPSIVSQVLTVERQVLERAPVIVERSETRLEYRAPQILYGAAVIQKQIVRPVLVERVQVQKVHAPAVIQQNTVERRGLFGRRVIRQSTVIR